MQLRQKHSRLVLTLRMIRRTREQARGLNLGTKVHGSSKYDRLQEKRIAQEEIYQGIESSEFRRNYRK